MPLPPHRRQVDTLLGLGGAKEGVEAMVWVANGVDLHTLPPVGAGEQPRNPKPF
jgi:hypothetical protein